MNLKTSLVLVNRIIHESLRSAGLHIQCEKYDVSSMPACDFNARCKYLPGHPASVCCLCWSLYKTSLGLFFSCMSKLGAKIKMSLICRINNNIKNKVWSDVNNIESIEIEWLNIVHQSISGLVLVQFARAMRVWSVIRENARVDIHCESLGMDMAYGLIQDLILGLLRSSLLNVGRLLVR